MEYNSLHEDIRMTKISQEDAFKILKSFEGNWIYIKSNVDKINENMSASFITNYNKIKVRNINIDVYSRLILIYGFEDEDRLVIPIDDIIQTEKTDNNDELLFILSDNETKADIYLKLFSPNLERRLKDLSGINTNLIITEGKTDWKHLKSAFETHRLKGLYKSLDFEFLEYEESLSNNDTGFFKKNYSGADTLNTICQYNAFFHNDKLRIFVFDADKENINKIYSDETHGYTYLGNNVYAIVLPVPVFRKDTPLISIENYYTDDEIKTLDKNGNRLYLSSEFNYDTGKCKSDESILSYKVQKDAPNFIIDDNVYRNSSNINISDKNTLRKLIDEAMLEKVHTLSKNKFAENILNNIQPFNNISKDTFKIFFDVVEKIFNHQSQIKSNKLGIIKSIQIQKGVTLDLYDNYQDLNFDVAFPDDKITELRSTSSKVMSISKVDNKIAIYFGISIEKEFILCTLDISEDLITFIHKKAQNDSNRCYLHIYNNNNEYIYSYEIFKGDDSFFQFERLYRSLVLDSHS